MGSLEIDLIVDAGCERQLTQIFAAPGNDVVRTQIESAARAAASVGDCSGGTVGVRLTDDSTIHVVNRDFLQHDYPTDVISFPYALDRPNVEGELIVSLDTAIASCQEYGWSAREELLLYVIHGTLHLVGFDDQSESTRQSMRHAEATALRKIGIAFPISKTVASEASQTN